MGFSRGPFRGSIFMTLAIVFVGVAGSTPAHPQAATAGRADDVKLQAAPTRSTSECAAARARVSFISEKPDGPALRQVAGTLTIGEGGVPVGNIELRVFVFGRPHDHRIISI